MNANRSARGAKWKAACALVMAVAVPFAKADSTWVYAVQVSAVVQASPPSITLNWQPDQYGANSYTVYRKSEEAASWGPGTTLSGSATSFTDLNVAAGQSYEYQIVKVASLGYNGYGYIYAGIDAPFSENRGTLILIVATESVVGLSTELARLQADLIGDGWQVIRHDVSSGDSPATVRNLIISDYYADSANVNAVFLFGHVPVLQSGDPNYDGHLARPMPADAYYGDVDGEWSGSPDYLPSDVELMVGRVDMFNMPGVGAPTPWPSEVELLRNYLNKDHNWRHKLLTAQPRALMGDRRGNEGGLATAASGYRAFEPLVGPGQTIQANIQDNAPPEQRWISMLTADSYLWAYGCGAGQTTAISGLGTSDGAFYDVRSTDIVAQDAKAVFVMVFGSWLGNWDGADDIMRSVLATPTMGLTCCMSGVPHWFCHHMGLGEPIGYSTRLTMNNSTLYQSQIFIALMGDPALRMNAVAPPSGLAAFAGSNAASLSWAASPDSVLGYHVYRATSPEGPFSRLTSSLLTGTSFSDNGLAPNTYTYMVRAVNRQTTPSGTYFNPSQGIFATLTVSGATTITVQASRIPAGVLLTWNSQPETNYRVLGKNSLSQPGWTDLSGSILATGTSASWTDTNIHSTPQRLYRISSP